MNRFLSAHREIAYLMKGGVATAVSKPQEAKKNTRLVLLRQKT